MFSTQRLAVRLFVLTALSSLMFAQQKPVRPMDSMEGEALYVNYCARCHGRDAKGGKTSPLGKTVLGPDLTRYAARHGGKFPLAEVRQIISGEKELSGSHGTRKMPVWGSVFSEVKRDQDVGQVRIDNLARYLRDLQVK